MLLRKKSPKVRGVTEMMKTIGEWKKKKKKKGKKNEKKEAALKACSWGDPNSHLNVGLDD